MSLSKRVRFEVFKRDAFTCRYCGRKPPEVMLHVDHVIPKAKGGPDDLGNLITSCVACNLGKSDKPLGEIVPAIDELALLQGMQEALEQAVNIKASIESARAVREAADEAIGDFRAAWSDMFGNDEYVMDRSIRTFIRKGLSFDELLSALDSAAGAFDKKRLSFFNTWRYFCGVCWGKIKARSAPADE